ncbi:hypothetical protein [Helicobacter cholecystus]|uniref:hypothetical protein n=1 Tax=Helicobacter cholecystus TaxID=45498 RepID=UPI0027384FAE|nr:hypothetical protein [Helicobacter cholecystus]
MMSNRENARKLREEVYSQANEKEQIKQLQESVEQLQGVCESLIENIASLEEENLELKRAMEAQSTSLSS